MESAKNVTQYELKMQGPSENGLALEWWMHTYYCFFQAKMTCKFSVVPR